MPKYRETQMVSAVCRCGRVIEDGSPWCKMCSLELDNWLETAFLMADEAETIKEMEEEVDDGR